MPPWRTLLTASCAEYWRKKIIFPAGAHVTDLFFMASNREGAPGLVGPARTRSFTLTTPWSQSSFRGKLLGRRVLHLAEGGRAGRVGSGLDPCFGKFAHFGGHAVGGIG